MPLKGLSEGKHEPPSDEELYQLILEIKEGKDHLREDFVKAFIPLVTRMAQKSSNVTKSNLTSDEYLAEGLLAVCVALDRLISDPKTHVTKYVITTVKYALYSYAGNSKLIRIPQATLNKMRKDNVQPPKLVFQKLPADLEFKITKVKELEELILSCCESPVERKAVELRRQNKILAEIAPVLGMSISSVSLMLLDIYKRFLEKSSDV